ALEYTIGLLPPGATRLQVDLRFRTNGAGPTRLKLPDAGWGNERRYFDAIDGLQIVDDTGAAATLRETGKPETRMIEHPPGAVVHLRYGLRQDWSGTRIRRFRPALRETWFHFFGHAALAHPAIDRVAPRPITIAWADVPAGFTIADSFGVGASTRRLT